MDTLAEPPPSYESSTSKEWLNLVGPYLTATDLCNAVLVCKRWYRLLLPQLWTSPAKHFATTPDDALTSFIHFRTCLSLARLETRSIVHTLWLPRTIGPLDYSAHPQWLLHAMQAMPCLQSLVFPNLPFLDHRALLCLQRQELRNAHQKLKLLSIKQCYNVTTQGLLSILQLLNGLIYIDLSGTHAARSTGILEALGHLKLLKVLILSNLALGDDAGNILCQNIGKQLTCLDISANHLTDKAVQTLSSTCLDNAFHPELPPDMYSSKVAKIHPASCRKYAQSRFDMLTSGPLSANSSSEIGLHYLDISKNMISGAAALQLVSNSTLRGLDIGPCVAIPQGQQVKLAQFQHGESQLEYLAIPYNLALKDSDDSTTGSRQGTMQRYLHTRLDSLHEVESERQKHALLFDGEYISPVLHPRLRTLRLSAVPATSNNKSLSQSLIEMIRDCALEERLAVLQARLDYRLPPGQTTTGKRLEEQAKNLFALEEIVLELTSPQSADDLEWSSWNHARSTKSVTGDADSMVMWDAAASDFSFFGNEPVASGENELDAAAKRQALIDRTPGLIDTVTEVSAFRKRVKKDYDSLIQSGTPMPKVDGFWSGKIQVVR